MWLNDSNGQAPLLLQVEVYTFGCPRVGNSTFSTEYDKRVPETWHIINDKDTVRLLHSPHSALGFRVSGLLSSCSVTYVC